jgi:hypothetical protein
MRRVLLQSIYTLPLLSVLPQVAGAATGEPASPRLENMDVMDFESLARAALPPAHFASIATGVYHHRTVLWNHEVFSLIEIRARRFVDVSNVDMYSCLARAGRLRPSTVPYASKYDLHPVIRMAHKRGTEHVYQWCVALAKSCPG